MTEDEYDALFRTAYPRLVAMGLSMSAERHVAQELAQETLLRAYRRRDELGAYDSPLAWCRRVMGNLLIDVHRSRTAEKSAVERWQARVGTEQSHGTGDDEVAHIATTQRWDELVSSLTTQQRLIATLYYAQDQSVGAVAQALDIADGTVKSALSKIRTNLRRSLGGTPRTIDDEEAWS